jgi:SSS family solute:Na+ symporter
MAIVAAVVLGTIAFALLAVRRIGSDPTQFILGGRSLGPILLWVLMGGELYTTFTFLGIAGWAYGRGAEIYYILAVGGGAYIVAYLYLPRLWRYAKERNLLTFADFFAARYGSKPFGAVTALISTCTEALALLLYLTGLQIILTIAGLGAINGTHAVLIAFGLITLFVFTAGLRGMAWASIIKDTLMLAGIAIAGFVLPIAFFGSPSAMLAHAIAARPQAFAVGAWMAGNGKLWYMSTAILNVVGFFVGVNAVAATYSAKSEQTVRRNAILLPLYSVMLVPMFFAGYTASLVLPGLHGTQSDSAYLRVLQAHFPLWLLGIVCAAGTLAGLLPSATRLLAAASQLMKNVLGDIFNLAKEGPAQTWVTRGFIVLIALVALLLWVYLKASLVDLLLFVYNGQAQFVPGILFGLFWNRVSLVPVAIGLLVGEVAALGLTIHPLPLAGLNPGFAALALNASIVVILTLLHSNGTFGGLHDLRREV